MVNASWQGGGLSQFSTAQHHESVSALPFLLHRDLHLHLQLQLSCQPGRSHPLFFRVQVLGSTPIGSTAIQLDRQGL